MKSRHLPLFLFPAVLFAAEPATPAPAPAKPAARRTLAQLAEDKRAVAAELVQLLRVEKMMADEIAGMRAGMDAQFDQALAGPAASQKALIQEYRAKLHAVINEGTAWKLMEADIIKAYADVYSEGELRELVAFFKSPVGKAFVDKGTQIGAAVRGVAQSRMQQVQPRIQSTFYELSLRLQSAMQAQQPQGAPQPQPPEAR